MKVDLEFQIVDEVVNLKLSACQEKCDLGMKDVWGGSFSGRSEVDIDLPAGVRKDHFHPDILMLAALVYLAPYTKDRIVSNVDVSWEFKDAVKNYLMIDLVNFNSSIVPRKSIANVNPALAFSGGVDSCAALLLMPKNTVPIFLHRKEILGVRTLYRSDAALNTCIKVEEQGYDVHRVGTTFEYLRTPTGYPTLWARCIGALLLCDFLNLTSVSTGDISEEVFGWGYSHFQNPMHDNKYFPWMPLFEFVGLPLSMPVSGLSEISTSELVGKYASSWLPQSCLRGDGVDPCMNCYKCFRKKLIESRVTGDQLPLTFFEMVNGCPEVNLKLNKPVVPLAVDLAYSLSGMYQDYSSDSLSQLKYKVSHVFDYFDGFDFMRKFYPNSEELISLDIRDQVLTSIYENFEEMLPSEVESLERWSAQS